MADRPSAVLTVGDRCDTAVAQRRGSPEGVGNFSCGAGRIGSLRWRSTYQFETRDPPLRGMGLSRDDGRLAEAVGLKPGHATILDVTEALRVEKVLQSRVVQRKQGAP